jgi:hypothetical protein
MGKKPPASFRSIDVRNLSIKCFYGPGPRLLVPVDTGDVERIVEHLRPRAGEQSETDASIAGLLTEMDAGHIAWRSSPASSHGPSSTAGCWQITYESRGGQKKRSVSGLQVHSKDVAGDRLSAEALRDAANRVLMQARQLWNVLDVSARPRLVIDPGF